MRSVINLRVVLGLLAISSADASPCKPATAATSATSTETSLVTSLASTAGDASATPSTVVETTVEISVSSSKTSASSVEVSDSSVTIETSATSATTDFATEHVTAEPSTTDLTTAAETTTTAAIPTFTMFASGSNAITGKILQSYSRNNAVVVFDPATNEDNPSPRQYSIDSQGRLVNDLGWYLCGYYRTTNDELNKPVTVVTCHGETPLQKAFLTCELSGSFGISCSVPAISCTSSGSPDTPPACVVATGTWSLNSVGVRASGHTWQIGNNDTPATYERMTMSIREV